MFIFKTVKRYEGLSNNIISHRIYCLLKKYKIYQYISNKISLLLLLIVLSLKIISKQVFVRCVTYMYLKLLALRHIYDPSSQHTTSKRLPAALRSPLDRSIASSRYSLRTGTTSGESACSCSVTCSPTPEDSGKKFVIERYS